VVVGRQVSLMQASGPRASVVPRCPPIEVQCDRKTAGNLPAVSHSPNGRFSLESLREPPRSGAAKDVLQSQLARHHFLPGFAAERAARLLFGNGVKIFVDITNIFVIVAGVRIYSSMAGSSGAATKDLR
jgi:hypothetical protein